MSDIIKFIYRGMIKEIWKDIKGYEGLYRVSNLGRVKSVPRMKRLNRSLATSERYNQKVVGGILESDTNSKGTIYPRVSLCKEGVVSNMMVHRLVLDAFVPNIDGKPCCNHKDGNRTNNCVDNLEWCTYSENLAHAFRAGLRSHRGENCPNSKLKENDVIEIKKALASGEKCIDLSRKYGVHKGTISAIKNGVSWNFVKY